MLWSDQQKQFFFLVFLSVIWLVLLFSWPLLDIDLNFIRNGGSNRSMQTRFSRISANNPILHKQCKCQMDKLNILYELIWTHKARYIATYPWTLIFLENLGSSGRFFVRIFLSKRRFFAFYAPEVVSFLFRIMASVFNVYFSSTGPMNCYWNLPMLIINCGWMTNTKNVAILHSDQKIGIIIFGNGRFDWRICW